MSNQSSSKPVSRPAPSGEKRNDGGGAPGPSYTIPCPPKPKKN